MKAPVDTKVLRRWANAGMILLGSGIVVAWTFRQVGLSRGIAVINSNGSPEALTAAIDFTLYGIISGCIIGLIGFVIFLGAVIRIHRRNRTIPDQANAPS